MRIRESPFRRLRPCRESKCDLLGVGEMGIGNTSSASALFSLLLDLAPRIPSAQAPGLLALFWKRRSKWFVTPSFSTEANGITLR